MPLLPDDNPPPLTVAASLVAVQGFVLVALAVLELVNVSSERMSLGVSTAVFFLVYGGLLLLCAWALTQQQGWTRGPVLITQLIQLGLAWNLRDLPLVAVALALTAAVVLAGMLHPATLKTLQE
ncbi:MAG TPA: hypothetical protein VFO49_04195 [Nocardioides sp.]|nr:hypothetical protein [Nocardioides sp.]